MRIVYLSISLLALSLPIALPTALFFFHPSATVLEVVKLSPPPSENPNPFADEPPANPFLDSVWAESHRNSYCQASSPFDAPYYPEKLRFQFLRLYDLPITIAFSKPYPDGKRVAWVSTVGFTGKIAKIDLENFRVIDEVKPEKHEMGISGAYSILSNYTFFVPKLKRIEAYGDKVAGERLSEIELKRVFEIPENALCDSNEKIVGITMTYDGMIAFATSHATVGVVSQDFKRYDVFHIGNCSERVSNSIAADEEGGIYVVTDKAMYRINWDGEKLTLGWRAEYMTGSQMAGRLGKGSGSTPSLMNCGDDRFVVITDGQKLMHMVLFWRDEIPEDWKGLEGRDRRIAAEVPVTFGFETDESYSEQSVLVRNCSAAITNNRLGLRILDLLPERLQPFSMLVSNLPGVAPYGVEKFVWDPDKRELRKAWANKDVSFPNAIPTMSAKTNLFYAIGQRGGFWTIEAINWENGEAVWYAKVSPLPAHNSFYAATEIGPDGCVYSGTLWGIVRFCEIT